MNIAITVQKNWIFEEKKFDKFSAEDGTGDLKVMSYLPRPLHQKNLLKIKAINNASSSEHKLLSFWQSGGNFKRSNFQNFEIA